MTGPRQETEGERIAAIGAKVDLMYESQKEFQADMRGLIGDAFEAIRQQAERQVTQEELADKLQIRDNRVQILEEWQVAAEKRLREVEKRPSWLTTIVLASVLTTAGSLIVGLVVYVLSLTHK